MGSFIEEEKYSELLEDITRWCENARTALVEAYWQIGKRIVEQEQQGQSTADYGGQLIARLSADLSTRLGDGFSERNLRNMRSFYLSHKIWQAPAKLSWTQHVELLPIKNAGIFVV